LIFQQHQRRPARSILHEERRRDATAQTQRRAVLVRFAGTRHHHAEETFRIDNLAP